MHLLSVDLEDWYLDVERGPGVTTAEAGRAFERQLATLERILDTTHTRCTFFVLGTTAERYPTIVARLASSGHEIAAHGYVHERLGARDHDAFEHDIARASEVLASITGTRPIGYRAPYFSLRDAQFDPYPALAASGYRYSSSTRGTGTAVRDGVLELPTTAMRIGRFVLPVGGGGWWRALPRSFVLACARQDAFLTYVHPHEFDPLPLQGRNRLHDAYVNTRRAGIAALFEQLLRAHRFAPYRDAT